MFLHLTYKIDIVQLFHKLVPLFSLVKLLILVLFNFFILDLYFSKKTFKVQIICYTITNKICNE